jgi:cobalt-zinc-cadmium resistance protein CzcA
VNLAVSLVTRTIHTVSRNLIGGGLLIIAVLLLLGTFKGGIVVSLAIPLSMLVAFAGMVLTGVSGNLLRGRSISD